MEEHFDIYSLVCPQGGASLRLSLVLTLPSSSRCLALGSAYTIFVSDKIVTA